MSRNNDATTGQRAGTHIGTYGGYRFVPEELAAKCRSLIESYHAIHGYSRLPDMLWHSGGRDVIECDRDLTRIFSNASKSRSAKRANDSFLLIATTIVSVEMLARDFAGWGKKFPAAKGEAEKILADLALRPRIWLMDMYLYPALSAHRQPASTVSPSSLADHEIIRN